MIAVTKVRYCFFVVFLVSDLDRAIVGAAGVIHYGSIIGTALALLTATLL